MNIVVIKLAGAGNIVCSGNNCTTIPWHSYRSFKIDSEYTKNILNQVKVASKKSKICIIVGGTGAFLYINLAKELLLKETIRKETGITIINTLSKIYISYLKKIGANVFDNPLHISQLNTNIFNDNDVVLLTGNKDYLSGDALAAEAAKILKSKLFLFKNGIPLFYVGFPNPTIVREFDIRKMISLSSNYQSVPGKHYVLDCQSLQIINKNCIDTWLINKDEITKLSEIITGNVCVVTNLYTRIVHHSPLLDGDTLHSRK